jgi:hypothetical protein
VPDLPAKTRRKALEALSRDALSAITGKLDLIVEDRRAQSAGPPESNLQRGPDARGRHAGSQALPPECVAIVEARRHVIRRERLGERIGLRGGSHRPDAART